MRKFSQQRLNRKEDGLNVYLGLMLEFIFVFFPMACLAVVLYDISVKGINSLFALIGFGVIFTWAVFRAVTFCMGKIDDLIDGLHDKRCKHTVQ
jgi:hypothetical protein